MVTAQDQYEYVCIHIRIDHYASFKLDLSNSLHDSYPSVDVEDGLSHHHSHVLYAQQQEETSCGLKVLDIHKEECPKEFRDKYIFDVPVLHMNDKFLMQHRVPEESLIEAIKLFESTGKINPKY
ncbi:hypothetical protein MUCCIDRAFT_112832 [Mucor lusitanicus CBS 277.49]|uniref:Thioredoxin domain-containing protein n=1 Tax=Mucor lusitanicus CBS 277.49 TaxID=747725 RepID=A0A162YYD0_MUCCL|nr:hypothetical protein MUCCIDRAFT_112832 [Mucor lusitanicus CBS 277.49]